MSVVTLAGIVQGVFDRSKNYVGFLCRYHAVRPHDNVPLLLPQQAFQILFKLGRILVQGTCSTSPS